MGGQWVTTVPYNHGCPMGDPWAIHGRTGQILSVTGCPMGDPCASTIKSGLARGWPMNDSRVTHEQTMVNPWANRELVQ